MTDKKSIAQPNRIDTRYSVYDGRELQRNVGIDEERFVAFALPSLHNGKRVMRDLKTPYKGDTND